MKARQTVSYQNTSVCGGKYLPASLDVSIQASAYVISIVIPKRSHGSKYHAILEIPGTECSL